MNAKTFAVSTFIDAMQTRTLVVLPFPVDRNVG